MKVRLCDHSDCERPAVTLVRFVGMYGSYCADHADLVDKSFTVLWSRPLTGLEKQRRLMRNQDEAA